jgi:hypothetical protein
MTKINGTAAQSGVYQELVVWTKEITCYVQECIKGTCNILQSFLRMLYGMCAV